jgi:hypothetical protein
MRQSDINTDLGSYLHERKSKPFWKKYTQVKIKPRTEEEIEVAVKEELKHDLEREAAQVESKIPHVHRHALEVEEAKVEEAEEVENAVHKTVDKTAEKAASEDAQEVVETVEKEHDNALHKFFKKLNFSKKDPDFELENNPEISMDDAELRELLHGLHNWIIQLPSDKLEKFKNSREFELYTKYLRKHNLIK